MNYLSVDNFLSEDGFAKLKAHSLACDYVDIENEVDEVSYPHICPMIPDEIRSEVLLNIEKVLGRPPKELTMFLRMSPAGVHVPHIAHNDLSMGDYSLMLYLSTKENAGTSFLRHKASGICYNPESESFAQVVIDDQNNPQAWAVTDTIKMVENRAAIFNAGIFHCAQPVGGFGDHPFNARIVLTVFFI